MTLANEQLSLTEPYPFEGMVTTRYQGSKRKVLPNLYKVFLDIEFNTSLDAFGGTGSVTHLLARMGKKVQYNDILLSNTVIAKSLFANTDLKIDEKTIVDCLEKKPEKVYKYHIRDNYENVYYTNEENEQLDVIVQNIKDIEDEITRAELFYCLFQSTISKRPYNLFHRANLHMRTKDVKRNFGNKATWEKSFLEHMLKFYKELKIYRSTKSLHSPTIRNQSAFDINKKFDLIYIDTPYAKSKKTQETNYFHFYHFLDALLDYDNIPNRIITSYPHKPIYEPNKSWYEQENIDDAFKALFETYKNSTLVISYRSDGHPSIDDLTHYLSAHFNSVKVLNLSDYKYVLSSKMTETKEVAIVASNRIG